MQSFSRIKAFTILLAIAACAPALTAQQPALTNPPVGAPPKIINIVYQGLIPGKEVAYASLLSRIAKFYNRASIPVYWITSSSATGDTRSMTLNFFDSFADMDTTIDSLNNALAQHSDLVNTQEDLLTNVTNQTNSFAIRRDDIGYRAATIDFSKARILRVATVIVRQGSESEFEDAMKSLAAAYEKVNADSPWVLYQVNAGAPSTTFVFFMPMRSMEEMDEYIARGKSLSAAEGPDVEERLRQAARDAYLSWDSELFFVSPRQSHVPTAFAAGDPGFWIP
ncbi:MAG TPA: hypothetical protein VJN21_05285 [Candidatus Acidoferrales bacterium]|nr:hypothetical protein [Candidatus Acidoferrales bacterium]